MHYRYEPAAVVLRGAGEAEVHGGHTEEFHHGRAFVGREEE